MVNNRVTLGTNSLIPGWFKKKKMIEKPHKNPKWFIIFNLKISWNILEHTIDELFDEQIAFWFQQHFA